MNREPIFECDGDCECTHHEEDLRVIGDRVLCFGCWGSESWHFNTEDPDWIDIKPFKSPHLTRNQRKMSFEDYWNQYGELHASFCGGDIKMFAREFWQSAQGQVGEE